MKKPYKLVDEWGEEGDILIPYDDENGLDKEKLEEAVIDFFVDSAETGMSELESWSGDAEKGFTVVVCVDPELDGLIEEVYLKEII